MKTHNKTIKTDFAQERRKTAYCKCYMLRNCAVLFLFATFFVKADCPEQRKLDIQTSVVKNSVRAGGNHGFMDVITISIPTSVKSIPFKSIELSTGEVAEYWIPLATKKEGNRIIGELTGDSESIKIFDFWVTYSDGNCFLYQAESIGSAYNKTMKTDVREEHAPAAY